MTLTEYLRKNSTFSILAIALAMSAAFFVGVSRLPTKYDANFSLTVNHRELQTSEAYSYDGYYALRATEIFTDTVVSWFHTPAILNEIREDAVKNYGKILPDELKFRVKKFSGQNILVTLSDENRERALTLAASAINITTTRAENLNQREDGNSLFTLEASHPLIVENIFSTKRAGLIGLFLGLALGGILIFFITPPRK